MAENFGNRLVKSIGWVLIGILVFLGSFYVLYKTEWRTDYSKVAEKAVPIEEVSTDSDFVYATGDLTSPEKLFDDLYLNEGDYIVAERKVEMYAYVEEKHTDEEDDVYYTYDSEWVEDVPDSDEFDEPRRYENPKKAEQSKRFTVDKAFLGEYEIDVDEVRFPGLKPLNLNDETVSYFQYEEIVEEEDIDYIFNGYVSYDDPEIGDLRISYYVLEAGDSMTVFGKLIADKIVAHHGEKEDGLYRLFYGTKDDAMATLKGEYKTAGWMGRILGFFMMWIGLSLFLKPLSVSMEIIPFLGGLGKAALGIITFVVALVLTFVTVLIMSIIHNIFVLIIIVGGVIGIGLYLNSMKPATEKKKP